MSQRIPFHLVVANQGAACIYSPDDDYESHSLVRRFSNPAAQRKLTDIETDRPGRSFDRRGPGRHALARERDSKDSATAHFAKDIVEELESLLDSSETKRYLLIAAPSMLGVLRHKLEHSGVSEPYRSLDKDIVDQSLESVREVVLKYQLNQQGIGETL